MPQTAPIIQLTNEIDLQDVDGQCQPSTSQACLVRIYPAGVSGSLIPLSSVRSSIGRDAMCDVELMDDFISREHAIIQQRDGKFFLQDCGSLNGTFINDQKVEGTQQLIPGDAIRIGNHILKFLSADHVEAQYHEAVYEMMTVDGLTGAQNRRFFEDAIEREIVRSQRHWRPMALLMFDVDHFKAINDQHGHLAGDECLKQLADRVRLRIRGEDLFARFGGEEVCRRCDGVDPEAGSPHCPGTPQQCRRRPVSDESRTDRHDHQRRRRYLQRASTNDLR